MRILGFDASSTTIGWSVLDIENNNVKLVKVDYLKPPKKGSIFSRLSTVKKSIIELLKIYKPDEVIIENIVEFMKNKSSAKTIILLALFNRTVGLTVYEYLNKEPQLLYVSSVRSVLKPKERKERLQKEEIPYILEEEFEIVFNKKFKRNGKVADETYDMADSIAVALAWAIKNSYVEAP